MSLVGLEILNQKHHSDLVQLVENIKKTNFIQTQAQFNWSEPQFRQELGSCKGFVFVREQKIAAFLCYREQVEALEITILGTAPEYQRQSLQTALLQHLKELAQSEKKAIWLEVHEKNQAALQFYTTMGFRRVGLRPRYYQDGASAILMSL